MNRGRSVRISSVVICEVRMRLVLGNRNRGVVAEKMSKMIARKASSGRCLRCCCF